MGVTTSAHNMRRQLRLQYMANYRELIITIALLSINEVGLARKCSCRLCIVSTWYKCIDSCDDRGGGVYLIDDNNRH